MKRILLFVAILTLFCVISVSAQVTKEESEYYLKSFPIDKLYAHTLGYRMDYYKQDRTLGSMWIPKEWLNRADSIGRMITGPRHTSPYATFVYKDGEVDHFRLYIIDQVGDPSWGTLETGPDYTNNFPNPQSKPIVRY